MPTAARPRTRSRASRRRRRCREGAGAHRRARPRVLNADECVGEIVNTQGVGPVRGLLQQRRRDREDDPLRLVLVGRPRLQGRARLPLLRGPQRRLDPRRRRELPRRPDRGGVAQRARRRARRGLRRSRRSGRRPGDGRARPRRPGRFDPSRSRGGSTPRLRSGRSGGRATCGSCAIRRRRVRTRS